MPPAQREAVGQLGAILSLSLELLASRRAAGGVAQSSAALCVNGLMLESSEQGSCRCANIWGTHRLQ